MATPAYCQKCRKNTWKVSLGSEKQIHLTCVCGYNFVIKPPTPKEILENNKDVLREFLQKMVPFCPLVSKCEVDCSESWYACFSSTIMNKVNPFGKKIDLPGATNT